MNQIPPHSRSSRPDVDSTGAQPAGLQRKGAIVVLSAFLLAVMFAMLAFGVDMGYIMLGRTQLQSAVDAGVMAGTAVLAEDPTMVEATVIDYVQRNLVGTREVQSEEITVTLGRWDEDYRTFTAGGDPASAVQVAVQLDNHKLFFAKLLNSAETSLSAEATATFLPRDIMVVLDYSGSMNDDSELRHISSIGRSAVEANLRQIYTELGSPRFGNMQWEPVYISWNSVAWVKWKLGLSRVRYPFPSGSWDDYISYVMTSSYISQAGYRKKYGYLTLVNYWLEKKPMYSQTPDLWKTSEQPITAVKDALSLFLGYIQEVESNDRVGLAVYTSSDDTAKLETGLTEDMQLVEDISRQRQAGHYDTMTNIGAGLRKARLELDDNARAGALKVVVLMTDGMANLPYNTSYAERFLLEEAQRCADAGYPVLTVSLGAGADTDLMQQVADITGGLHFNIPGGQSVEEYEEDLKEVFRRLAAHRPLKLVK